MQLTCGALTDVIHRVSWLRWNFFVYHGGLCGSTTDFASGRANHGIQRWRCLGQSSRMGHLSYRGGNSPFNLFLHIVLLFFKPLLHLLAPLLLFMPSSSFATSIGVQVSFESKLPQHHPVASATSWVFRILERQSELINLSVYLQSVCFDIFNVFQYRKCLPT